MGRWPRQPTTGVPASATGSPVAEHLDVAADSPHATPDRQTRLSRAAVQVEGPWAVEARKYALRLRLAAPPPLMDRNDVTALGELARYLASWADGRGYLDPGAALRAAEIDRWAAREIAAGSPAGSIRSRRGRLVEAARQLHPREFGPPRGPGPVPRQPRFSPLTEGDLAAARHVLSVAPEGIRTKAQLCIAFGLAVGGRESELRALRGHDVYSETVDGEERIVVRLVNREGRQRIVPALDPDAAEYLYARAQAAGSDLLIGSADKNALNRAQEHMRRRGVNVPFSVRALRYLWLVRLAELALPLAVSLRIADTWHTEVFIDIERSLRAYSIQDTLRLIDHSKQGDLK